jgi:ubiquilin
MADDAATSTEDAQITFNVKAANDQKHVLTLAGTTTVADLKSKLSASEYADIPADRQRLIYSGRVLKDPDTLASVKLKDGHTIHLVKGAAGTGNNPLAAMTGARYAGFHGLPGLDSFGPDGGVSMLSSEEDWLLTSHRWDRHHPKSQCWR